MRFLVLAFMIGTCVSYGQRLSYGAKGGVSATEPTREPSPFSNDESRRYVAGATIEYRVWGGFAVESDFLYRRNGLTETFGDGIGSYSFITGFNRVRAHVFELPVMGKYYFRRNERTQPFLLTGYSFRKTLVDYAFREDGIQESFLLDLAWSRWTPLESGASFGVGLRWRLGRISISPELRYTRWGSQPYLGVSQQQTDFLLGITF